MITYIMDFYYTLNNNTIHIFYNYAIIKNLYKIYHKFYRILLMKNKIPDIKIT